LGVRLNTYTDSIEGAGALCPGTWDLSPLSSRVIPRKRLRLTRPTQRSRNSLAVHPHAVHSTRSRLPVGSGWNFGLQFFADVRLGRMRQIFSFCSLGSFPRDVVREIERAGGGGEPPARAPGGRTSREVGRWPPLPINAPESLPRANGLRGCRAQRRPAVLGAPMSLVCGS